MKFSIHDCIYQSSSFIAGPIKSKVGSATSDNKKKTWPVECSYSKALRCKLFGNEFVQLELLSRVKGELIPKCLWASSFRPKNQ